MLRYCVVSYSPLVAEYDGHVGSLRCSLCSAVIVPGWGGWNSVDSAFFLVPVRVGGSIPVLIGYLMTLLPLPHSQKHAVGLSLSRRQD